jgi:basic membrane protein A
LKRTAVAIIAICFVLILSCTQALDWSKITFPCNEQRPCTTGYICDNGFCVSQHIAEGTTPDAGTPEQIISDSPYRPPLPQPRVAFLYVGPIGDFGWTWAHEQGRLHLDKLGYDTTAAESVSVKDAPAQMETFIKRGYNVVIGTSHDFLVPMLSSSAKFEDINFLNCSGFEVSKNLGSYFGRLYQMEWLAGMVAGKMTKTNRVGIITAIAIPEMVRHINAFVNGVRYANPKAVVLIRWIGNWFDPVREGPLTQELLDANADVIHSHTDTSIPLEYIENKGGDPRQTKDGDQVYTIAYNSINGCSFGLRTCLTSVYWNWGPVLERIITQIKQGKWDPSVIIWEQLKSDKGDSCFYMSDLSDKVPGQSRMEIMGMIPKLAKEGQEGQQMPFAAPQIDNNGKVRLAQGKYFSDQDLLNMCWFVSGVTEDDGVKPAQVPPECKGDR